MTEKIQTRYPGAAPVICIGASSGGVNAMKQLVANIPGDFPAPIFLMLHRKIDSSVEKDLLADILKFRSNMEVVVPDDGDVIKGGRIYIGTRNYHTILKDGHIRLVDKPDNIPWRPSIDVLFKSAAMEYKDSCISVLLTGSLDDGVDGLIETTREGGITIVQSPEDAYKPDMPLNALLNDHPVYVLPLKDMPALFSELVDLEFSDDQKDVLMKAAAVAYEEKKRL